MDLALTVVAQIPERYADQPELVAAIIEARTVQMETEDTAFAIEWLLEHAAMSVESATRALGDETFRYPALYPEGHPGLHPFRPRPDWGVVRELVRVRRAHVRVSVSDGHVGAISVHQGDSV